MGTTEYVLLIVVVIGVPLLIAVAVTLWSLKQVQYRPKRRRPRLTPASVPATDPSSADPAAGGEPAATGPEPAAAERADPAARARAG